MNNDILNFFVMFILGMGSGAAFMVTPMSNYYEKEAITNGVGYYDSVTGKFEYKDMK